MFEDFSSEMVSQVALFLLIGIALGLLFDTSAVSLGRSGAQGVQCIAISKLRMAAARSGGAGSHTADYGSQCTFGLLIQCAGKKGPSCRRGE